MNETTKIAFASLVGVLLGGLLVGLSFSQIQDNPIESFCMRMVNATQDDRGYKDTEILAGCFESLTGRKIELK